MKHLYHQVSLPAICLRYKADRLSPQEAPALSLLRGTLGLVFSCVLCYPLGYPLPIEYV